MVSLQSVGLTVSPSCRFGSDNAAPPPKAPLPAKTTAINDIPVPCIDALEIDTLDRLADARSPRDLDSVSNRLTEKIFFTTQPWATPFIQDLGEQGRQLLSDFNHELQNWMSRFQLDYVLTLDKQDETPNPTAQDQVIQGVRQTLANVRSVCQRFSFFISQGLAGQSNTPANIMKLAQAAVENLASQKNIQLTLPDDAQLNGLLSPNESAPPLKLRIKDYQLYLVFSNLLQNAVKYSPDNSRVEASWRLAQPGEAPSCQDGYFSPTKRYVVFSVTDHGIGIPQAERKKVRQGERGSNAKAAGIPGTGHGLMRLELMLAQVGGQVDIESPIHADSASPGSRISCWIPLE